MLDGVLAMDRPQGGAHHTAPRTPRSSRTARGARCGGGGDQVTLAEAKVHWCRSACVT